ncbi:MAG: hypothetical protein KF901_12265 [Myxococcales bacterium]|nr:hypothetical protein [Myxococcales bacterium]
MARDDVPAPPPAFRESVPFVPNVRITTEPARYSRYVLHRAGVPIPDGARLVQRRRMELVGAAFGVFAIGYVVGTMAAYGASESWLGLVPIAGPLIWHAQERSNLSGGLGVAAVVTQLAGLFGIGIALRGRWYVHTQDGERPAVDFVVHGTSLGLRVRI